MATTARELQGRRRWPAEIFAERLRARRAVLGLRYEDVSERLGTMAPTLLGAEHDMATSVGKVRNIMKGANHPKLPEIPVWAAALETNVGYLLGFSPEEGPDPELPSPTGNVGTYSGVARLEPRRLNVVALRALPDPTPRLFDPDPGTPPIDPDRAPGWPLVAVPSA